MQRIVLYVAFLILGMNYLLPFNTIINSYIFFTQIVGQLPLSPEKTLLAVNAAYQIAAIIINSLSLLKIMLFNGYERPIGIAVGVLSSLAFLTLGMLVWFKVSGLILLILFILISFLTSSLQSIGDNCNLFFCNQHEHKHTLLLYATGINVSGTVYALLLIALNAGHFSNREFTMFSIYYASAAAILLLSPLLYCFVITKNLPVGGEWRQGGSITTASGRFNREGFVLTLLALFNFSITLFVFPSLAVRLEAYLPPQFNNVIVFLGYNASALGGNLLALFIHLTSLKQLFFGILVRVILSIPFVVIYKHCLDNTYMTYIHYFCIVCVHGFSSGYLISCIFYYGNNLRNTLANNILLIRLINLAISFGLTLGMGFSFSFTYLIHKGENCSNSTSSVF